jgi:hypothetical protein
LYALDQLRTLHPHGDPPEQGDKGLDKLDPP